MRALMIQNTNGQDTPSFHHMQKANHENNSDPVDRIPNTFINRRRTPRTMSEGPAADGATFVHAPAPGSVAIVRNVLRALADSRLTADERAGVCAGVLRSVEGSLAGPGPVAAAQHGALAVDVEALSDPEDVHHGVEASWLVLQERLRSGIDPATASAEVRRGLVYGWSAMANMCAVA